MSDDEAQLLREVPVDWIVPEAIPTQRATNVIIQQSGPTEFVVAFFEQRPPFFTGSREQQLEQFKMLEKIPAVCVAKITLSADKLVEFASAFKESVDDFHQVISAPLKEGGDE